MGTQIIKKTKTPFLFILAALVGFSDTALADNTNYTTQTFSADCLLFNGISQIFENSVTCKKAGGQSIICLRQDDAVSGCKLENSLPDQTTARPQNQQHQSSADFLNKALH